MFKNIFFVLFCLLKLSEALPITNYALDFTDAMDFNQLINYENSNYRTVIPRVSKSDGEVDKAGIASLAMVHANPSIFMKTAMYLTPKVGTTDGSAQISKLKAALTANKLPETYVYIQVSRATASWSSDTKANVALINSLITNAIKNNFQVGIYSSHADWVAITGNVKSLSGTVSLWYSNVFGPGVTGESKPNYDDFVAFGPFTKAMVTFKQFAMEENMFGVKVNRNVYGSGL